jgi:hypothetical protein
VQDPIVIAAVRVHALQPRRPPARNLRWPSQTRAERAGD